MIYVAKSIESWAACKPEMYNFLETECEFLFIAENTLLSPERFHISSANLPGLDLIQFATLRPWQRGELGIREIHWRFSEFVSGNKFIFRVSQLLSKCKLTPVSKIAVRYESMRIRRSAVRALSKEFAHFGTVIPHYIEPCKSSFFLSRAFVKALLEINVNDELSMFRAIFALARTANFDCLRISGY